MRITTIDGNGNFVRLTYNVEVLKPKQAKYFLFFNLESEFRTEEVRIMPNGTIQRITIEAIRPDNRRDMVSSIIDEAFSSCSTIYENAEEKYQKVIDNQLSALAKNRSDIRAVIEHMIPDLSVLKTENIDDDTNEFFGIDTEEINIPEIQFPDYDD